MPLGPWGQRSWGRRVEVVGEAFDAPHVRALFGNVLKERDAEQVGRLLGRSLTKLAAADGVETPGFFHIHIPAGKASRP